MHRRGGRGRALARRGLAALVLGLSATPACGELDVSEVEPEVPAEGDVPGAPSAPRDCDSLLARFREQLHEQIRARVADALSRYTEGAGDALASADPLLGSLRAASSVAPELKAAPDALGAVEAASPGAPSSASEGDILAIEGNLLYLVKGEYLHVLDVSSALAIELRASLAIEGDARQLLVRDGIVFVFSAVSPPADPSQPFVPPPPSYYPLYSKLTVVDASNELPSVLRETYLEGEVYGAVQRRGDRALVALQQSVKIRVDYPSIDPLDTFGRPVSAERMAALLATWAEIRVQSIETSTLDDFLPRTQERVDGELVQRPFSCTEQLVPAGGPGTSQFTRLVTIALDAPEAPFGELSFLGRADSVPAGHDAFILREPDPSGYGSPHTNLHRLVLDGAGLRLTGTGRVDGYLDGMIVLDEAEGVIRAAVSSNTAEPGPEPAGEGEDSGGASRVSRVVTLDAHSSRLRELGSSPPFGQGEWLAGGRFLGDAAYLSTAVEGAATLNVLDLEDPLQPALVHRVATKASTPLLLPLPDARMLGLGDALDETSGWHVALQWFDVGDPTAPRLVDEYVSSKPGRLTALDERAVSIDLGAGVVALARDDNRASRNVMDVFQLPASEGFAPLGLVMMDPAYIGREACLAYWGYPSDADALAERGVSLDYVEVLLGRCEALAGAGVRRSFVAGDVLVSLTARGIAVHGLDALAAPPQYEIELAGSAYPWN